MAMAWIGKVAGALIGFAIWRWPGAILGAILGHQFDRGMAGRGAGRPGGRRRRSTPAERQQLFFETTFIVMGHLAKSDGRVSEVEIAAARDVMQRMQLGEADTRLAMDLFNRGKRPDFPVDDQVARFRRHCGSEPQLVYLFLEIQVDLALASGSVTPGQRELLARIADALGVGRIDLLRIEALLRARRRGAPAGAQAGDSGLERAYATLGVEAAASDAEVKTAYRRLMNEHHPDKAAARGLPESMRRLAEERTQEIRAAWELVRERRGLR